MYYYTFKATSKDGKIVKEYLYNEAITNTFNKEVMMTLVKEFIKKEFDEEGLNIKDFTFTRKLQSYKDFRARYDKYKYIDNRNLIEADVVPEEMKQSKENKKKNKEIARNTRNKYKSGARLPTSPYGAWAMPKDPNFKY